MIATIETIDTPDGPFTILEDDARRVLASGWTDQERALFARLATRPGEVRRGRTDAAAAARAYYDGDLAAIDTVEVSQSGTPLQRAGWAALRTIVPGQPLSYALFAERIGRPSAVRAAAAICARNAPALFVPCHRVLRTGGALGGFAWGVEVKRSLLEREAA